MLVQTYQQLEIVVVIDGQDPLTTAALADIRDDRLRWIEVKETVGGSEARNIGIRNATGNWVALLDDDDEWLPTKLEEQMDEMGLSEAEKNARTEELVERVKKLKASRAANPSR